MPDVRAALVEHRELFHQMDGILREIENAAGKMIESLKAGGKIVWMGNGGSASQSQHFATELVGRFYLKRDALASISLSADTAVLTAIGNDFGFEEVFARQVQALCKPGDVVVGLSTSGRSANVLKALKLARELRASTVGMTGGDGGEMEQLCDVSLVVPSQVTARIQEAHLWIGHVLCELVEEKVAGGARSV